MKSVRIATRGSRLALTQAEIVTKTLKSLDPSVEISIVIISTKGDRDKSDFLYKAESVGFFTSEVANALLDGRADLAVHSLKDLPTTIRDGLVIAAVPKRENPADVIIARGQMTSIADIPAGATVGTSSLRRIAQIKNLRDDLKCVPMRGNVETRLSKVASGQLDAAILAYAGLNRLGLSDKVSLILSPRDFIPAPAQGALGLQTRANDMQIRNLVAKLDDAQSRLEVEAERHVLAAMHGGCSIPLGVYAEICNSTITINAMLSDPQGKNFIRRSITSPADTAIKSAQQLAQQMLSAGGREILDQIRQQRN
ncbi:MAG: hydroxymethylbilane synthase [Candidatus Brocadiia bacterium]|nr:MAG: hydroxymethylbilane synthase [Candidatus Brocadiia bacterium]